MTDDHAEAVVCDGAGHTSIGRLRLAAPGPTDVVIRCLVSGVSTGTDKWVMQGRFVWRDIVYPVVPGYQAAGVVEAVGAEVKGIRIDQQVAATAGRAFVEVESAWGTHASRIVADRSEVYDATGIPAARAAFIVSSQVGYNAASRLQLEAGSRVLVVGDGIIGASAALACVARGFAVLVLGRHEPRLAVLRSVGLATHAAGDAAREAMAEYAPLAVIDTVQNDEAFGTYVDALPRATGQLVYSGHSPGGVTAWADMAVLQKREFTVHFVAGMLPHRLEATLALMRDGRMPTDRLVGVLADGPRDAERLMTDVAAGALRPVAAAIDWGWAQ